MKVYKNFLFFLGNIFFVLSIIIIGIVFLLKADVLKTFNLEGYSNNFCQTLKKTKNNLDYLVCDNKYKKSKIILLLVDALAYDQLYALNNLSYYRIPNFFKAEGLDYKQSGSLFESIFTGKFSRNYMAEKITIDNLAQQFKMANMNVFYKARSFPLDTLIDKKFTDKFEVYQGEEYPLESACIINLDKINNFSAQVVNSILTDDKTLSFKKGYNVSHLYEYADIKINKTFEELYKSFNHCFKEINFNSMVFFTEVMDHYNHAFFKYFPSNRFHVYYLEKFIDKIIKWINDNHGEYALVLGSDHGGQYYFGEDTLCNHGCNLPGNEGILFVYTKELGENYEKLKLFNNKEDIPEISINDYSCTISQVLKNVNLPLESTCIPRAVGNDKLLKFTSVKSKEIQLKQYIEKLYTKYPGLNKKYKNQYYNKLEKNEYFEYFKNEDFIYKASDEFYEKYMNYLINIQKDLNEKVKQLGQSIKYYFSLYSVILFFIIIFYYDMKNIITSTRKKFYKLTMKQSKGERTIILKDSLLYIYILLPILFIDIIILLMCMNSKFISNIINFAVFIKLLVLLLFLSIIFYLNRKKNGIYKLKKIIIILFLIILVHFIMYKIKFFSYIDRNVNTQKKMDLFKYISYPLILIYSIFELYSNKNYYISEKYNIRYIYIIIPYLLILSFLIIKYDLNLMQHYPGNPPHIIALLKIIYSLTLLLPLFFKPFIKIKKNRIILSKTIINFKLFLLVFVLFVCTEIDRVEIVPLYCYVLFYLTNCFVKERELFFKIIYFVIMNIYPHIHFIGNQGTYTLDTSIKITPKSPAPYADDRPIIMGILFVLHKFKFYFIYIAYIYSIYKLSINNFMCFYTKIIRLFQNSQLFAMTFCFLIYLKNEKENSYIQILFLIGTKALVVIILDFAFLLNYFVFKCINLIYYKRKGYINKIDFSNEEENNILKMLSSKKV